MEESAEQRQECDGFNKKGNNEYKSRRSVFFRPEELLGNLSVNYQFYRKIHNSP